MIMKTETSFVSARQRMPNIADKAPKVRKRQGRIPSQVSQGAWPC